MPITKRRFVPFDLLCESILSQDVTRCAAHMNNGERCTTKLTRSTVDYIAQLYMDITTNDGAAIDDEEGETLLNEVARFAICGRQNNERAKGVVEAAVEQWKSELRGSQTATSDSPVSPEETVIETPFASDNPSESLSEDLCDGFETLSIAQPRTPPQTPPRNANAHVDNHNDSCKEDCTPYKIAIDDGKVIRELKDAILESKTAGKPIPGGWKHDEDNLYIIESRDVQGMYKVGNSRETTRRFRTHSKCFDSFETRQIKCPNAPRFERILQLELVENRYRRKCHRCKCTEHTELFKSDYEALYQRIRVWCEFANDIRDDEKRSQVTVPDARLSFDPDRWYKWAQGYVLLWRGKSSLSQLNTPEPSFVEEDSIIEAGRKGNLHPDDDLESVPPLSPPSSAPSTPGDCYSDPPTPSPAERSRSGKPPALPRISTSTAWQIESPEQFYSAVEKMPQVEYPDLWCHDL
ncbi:GIY-YIG nuclease family protein [Aspergillus stella-maris]|uniref:GIY-YIG nuclease family protein n=1 Tax=Aspergillus stella-maris TaxID=1810926 RepID=UPI003CCC8FE5